MAEKLFQKGANGLVAEYRCAETLHKLLSQRSVDCSPSSEELSNLLCEAIGRVAGDLSQAQLNRALNQGDALGKYITDKLMNEPEVLGLSADLVEGSLEAARITPTGHLTCKEGSSDIDIDLYYRGADQEHLEVSLKAYRGSISSLGSKGARASLARMFFGKPKISDEEFVNFFSSDAHEFISLIEKFKMSAAYFYEFSEEGKHFVDAYERERGTRKVNNKLRRAQVGEFFVKQHGFLPEHKFAELYGRMFNTGFSRVGETVSWDTFLEGAEFVLGIEGSILTLNAVAGDDGVVSKVVNSFTSSAYGMLRATLAEGCDFRLTSKEQSSILNVSLTNGALDFTGLTLAIWKDATIQFKIKS